MGLQQFGDSKKEAAHILNFLGIPSTKSFVRKNHKIKIYSKKILRASNFFLFKEVFKKVYSVCKEQNDVGKYSEWILETGHHKIPSTIAYDMD